MNVRTAQTGSTHSGEMLSLTTNSGVLWFNFPRYTEALAYRRTFLKATARLQRAVSATAKAKHHLLRQLIEICLASRAAWTALYDMAVWAPELLDLQDHRSCEVLLRSALRECRRVEKVSDDAEVKQRLKGEIIPNIAWRSFISGVLRLDGVYVVRRLLTEDTFRILSDAHNSIPKEWRRSAKRRHLAGTPVSLN